MIFIVCMLTIVLLVETIIVIHLHKQNKENKVRLRQALKSAEKDGRLFRMAVKWAEKNERGKFIEEYLMERNLHSVIIYGMHFAGELLAQSLEQSGIEVVCGIDASADYLVSFRDVIKPSDTIPAADVIIVTAVTAFPMIEESLRKRVDCPIVSLEDIIYE